MLNVREQKLRTRVKQAFFFKEKKRQARRNTHDILFESPKINYDARREAKERESQCLTFIIKKSA